MIFGITGYKGHGKDTFAKYVQELDNDYAIIHFAKPLKDLVIKVFGLSDKQVNDPVIKEKSFTFPVFLDHYVDALSKETGLDILKRDRIASSPRQLMQYIGTDYIRSVCPTYWIDRAEKLILQNKKCLVPDARFLNEAELIRAHGGKIIRISCSSDKANSDLHISETMIDSIKYDINFVAERGDLESLKNYAAMVVNYGNALSPIPRNSRENSVSL